MSKTISIRIHQNSYLFLLSSLLLTYYLFYVDEGQFLFNCLVKIEQELGIGVNILLFFLGQLVTYQKTFERYLPTKATIMAMLIGIPSSIFVAFLMELLFF